MTKTEDNYEEHITEVCRAARKLMVGFMQEHPNWRPEEVSCGVAKALAIFIWFCEQKKATPLTLDKHWSVCREFIKADLDDWKKRNAN